MNSALRHGLCLAAVSAAAVLAASKAAVASPCIFDPNFFIIGDEYILPECSASAGATDAVGQSVSGTADQFIQQQLNTQSGFVTDAGPTGRLRHTNHDGLKATATNGATSVTDKFDVNEGSVFANVTYNLPGTVLGGKVRISGLAGYNGLTQKTTPSVVGNDAKSEIDAAIFGGSYLWSQGSFYTMSLVVGIVGDLKSTNTGGSFTQDIAGYVSNSVVGNTFDLAGNAKFDLRAGLGSTNVRGDEVTNLIGTYKSKSTSWNGSLTGTLFTVVSLENGAVLRPYALASYKHVFSEEIELKGLSIEFDQADNYGKGELGFDMVQGIYTFGAAAYTEFSGDQNTFGGRLGMSIKLQ